MPSLRTTFAAILALGAIAPTLAQIEVEGCYDTQGDTKNYGPNTYQTQGLCLKQCLADNKAVWAVTKGSTCFCGDALPSTGKVDIGQCDKTCQGYGESCGGDITWLFGYTGALPPDVANPTTTGSKTTTKTNAPLQTTVVAQDTATVTATTDTQPENAKSGTTSKAGIAAGAVVGVISVIAIGVGAFLLVRRNRRRQAEEEYRAAVAAKEFTASIRKPAPDSRLDPVMLQHRLSDGSIADNQDFSRRILKVTNPDA